MNFLKYLVLSTISLSICYALYLLIFRNDTNFKQLRFYLLASIVLSISIPLTSFKIDIVFSGFKGSQTESILEPTSENITATDQSILISEVQNSAGRPIKDRLSFNWILLIKTIYFSISIFILIRILSQLVYIVFQYYRSEKVRKENLTYLYNSGFKSTFTFFNWIFLNNKDASDEDATQIISHEKIHAQQLHSFDLILIELLAAVMWFNPVVWLMRNTIQLVHEYLADEGALDTGIDRLRYQALLVNQATEEKLICLSSSFNHSIIKKRIVMMTKSKLIHKTKLKILALLPIAALLFIGVACINGQNSDKTVTAIAPAKMNVLYVGVENPVTIASSGYDSKDLKVENDNGTITGENGIYNVIPKNQGIANIVVKHNDKIIQNSQFRVKVVPDPVATISGKKGGDIVKHDIIQQMGINVMMENFDFDVAFQIVEFSMSLLVDGKMVELRSNSGKFTTEQIQLLQKTPRPSIIYFQGIKCKGPDGMLRQLSPMQFNMI